MRRSAHGSSWPRTCAGITFALNFQGIIPQLDRLKSLGVTVLWLMPIHPVGKLKAKGSLGSPYAPPGGSPTVASPPTVSLSPGEFRVFRRRLSATDGTEYVCKRIATG
ncbi:MAG TPA: hypothetical protein VF033_02030 [Steroidobacteraceae bacterium]